MAIFNNHPDLPMTQNANHGNHIEILLVEDNPNDAAFALRAFKKQNLDSNVIVVTDGAAALDFIFAKGSFADRNADELPKVVFLDIKLPKVGGLEVLKRIKSDKKTSMIPVVMLTSSKEDQDIVTSYALGASSYIVKPMEFEKFIESVAELARYWLSLNTTPRT